ncbi:MAG: hypothetical protein NVS2B12_12250 [Ktedonobacteraceae bacterium]
MDDTGSEGTSFDEQVHLLKKQYVFQEDQAIEAFLRRNPFLVPFLFETSTSIKALFPDARVFLHTAYHAGQHTENQDSEELVAFISTHIGPQKAMETLKQFYGTWWSQAVKRTQGKIAIGLECL